jgi:hypothetical protein
MHRLLEAAQDDPAQQQEIFEGVQRLVDPEGMGGIYKVMAITSPVPPLPPLFVTPQTTTTAAAPAALVPTGFGV